MPLPWSLAETTAASAMRTRVKARMLCDGEDREESAFVGLGSQQHDAHDCLPRTDLHYETAAVGWLTQHSSDACVPSVSASRPAGDANGETSAQTEESPED